MEVLALFVIGLIVVLFLLLAGACLASENDGLAALFTVLGLFSLVLFSAISSNNLRDGSPAALSKLTAGHYKVAFVYQAGDYVSLGLNIADGSKDKVEYLYLYQSNKQDFAGQIKNDATELDVVVTPGGYTKLVLK